MDSQKYLQSYRKTFFPLPLLYLIHKIKNQKYKCYITEAEQASEQQNLQLGKKSESNIDWLNKIF